MGIGLNLVTPLHQKTSRDYLGRMMDRKVEGMKVARRYGPEFWDGDRRYGYGGYRYDRRWRSVAQALIDRYQLPAQARILDVGCGKGYLLYEFRKLLPSCRITGLDLSAYALEQAPEEVRPRLLLHKAQDPYPFGEENFDLVTSLGTLHNLPLFDLKAALKEIERVGRHKYVVVESYRNEEELFNLQCWALTCAAFFTPQEWIWLFREFGYGGDFEFIFFE